MARSWITSLALRYLWARKGEAFITIIALIGVASVALGTAVLVMVLAIMTGFERELKEKIIGTNAPIVIRHPEGTFTGWREFLPTIEQTPGVTGAAAFTLSQALLRTERYSGGVLVRGVDPGSSAWRQLSQYVDSPESLTSLAGAQEAGDEQLAGAIVGRDLARNFGLVRGSVISLLSPQVGSSPFGLVPRFKRFTVVGTFHSGLVDFDERAIFVRLDAAQAFFRLGSSVSGIEVRVKSLDESAGIAAALKRHPSLTGFYVQDWSETNRPLWEAIRLERTVYFLVVLLIVVMASVSIVSMLVMLVLEKRRDIGVLKTLGASSAEIRKLFLLQGMIVGGAGTIAGLVLGVTGCWALETFGFPLPEGAFPMSELPVDLEMAHLVIVGVCGFLICLGATLYPSRRASAVDPVQVLKFE